MTNFHGQIMNLQMPTDGQISDAVKRSPNDDTSAILAYKYGHRDARQTAAEMMVSADALVAELERQIGLQAELHRVEMSAKDARIAELGEDAATFRRLLNIAQQVHGLDSIGQAFTEIERPRAQVANLGSIYGDVRTAMTGEYNDDETLAKAIMRMRDERNDLQGDVASLERANRAVSDVVAGYRMFEESSAEAVTRMRAELESARAGEAAALERVAELEEEFSRLRIFAADLHDVACNGFLDPDLLAMRGVGWITDNHSLPSSEEVERAYQALEASDASDA